MSNVLICFGIRLVVAKKFPYILVVDELHSCTIMYFKYLSLYPFSQPPWHHLLLVGTFTWRKIKKIITKWVMLLLHEYTNGNNVEISLICCYYCCNYVIRKCDWCLCFFFVFCKCVENKIKWKTQNFLEVFRWKQNKKPPM